MDLRRSERIQDIPWGCPPFRAVPTYIHSFAKISEMKFKKIWQKHVHLLARLLSSYNFSVQPPDPSLRLAPPPEKFWTSPWLRPG